MNHRIIKLLLHLVCLLGLSANICIGLEAAEYYVSSKKGNDKANGRSPATAWKTLKRACSQLGSNDTLLMFRGSVFREADVQVSAGKLVAYGPKEYPLPVLAGSIAIDGWKPAEHDKNIYVANCAAPVQHVYCNGKLLMLARFPNVGWLRADTGNSATLINASVLSEHKRNKRDYWKGSQVRWRRWSWWFETRIVDSWDGQKALRLAGAGIGPNHNGDGSGFYLDNKFEELDFPGEWYYDAAKKKLYVYPPKGVDIGEAMIEAVVHDKGVQMSGGTLSGLEIRHYKDQALGFARPAIVEHCVFRGNTNVAISGSWNANGSTVRHCLFEDNLNVGITWNEDKSQPSKTSFHHNTFNDTGMVAGYGGSGVWHASAIIISNANGVHVHHNRINRTGYCGIIVGSPNQIIEYNVFIKCMSTLNDGGAIYTNCDATTIRHNIIIESVGENQISSHKWANLGQGIWPEFLDDFKDTKIINNTVVNCGCHGIFLGNNYNCEITGNVLFGNKNGLFLNGRPNKPPQNHTINNNVFVSMGDDQTPILFRTGYNFGSMSGNMFANPYASWIASNGNNWQRGHMDPATWSKEYAWADKSPKTFIGKLSPGTKGPIGRPHCFINDTEKEVHMPIKGTWYSIDRVEYKDSITLAPFSSLALILAKGSPGDLKGDYTLYSNITAAAEEEQLAVAKKTNKSKKRKKADKKKTVKAEPKFSDDVLAAWEKRLIKELKTQLKTGKAPYFAFMGKQYRVDELQGTSMKISSGSQKMTYPVNRLKLKDKASLAVGLAERGKDEAKAIAVVFLAANGDSKEASVMMKKVGGDLRKQLEEAGL